MTNDKGDADLYVRLNNSTRLIEARRRAAEQAVLLVHEFRSISVPKLDYRGTKQEALAQNAEAWRAFISALGAAHAKRRARARRASSRPWE